MRRRLQRIGNAKGIVIPKAILDRCGFVREVEMRVDGNRLILSPAKTVREGWSTIFRKAVRTSPEAPSPDPLGERWDREEWSW